MLHKQKLQKHQMADNACNWNFWTTVILYNLSFISALADNFLIKY